jgi:hypothetical protein
VTAIPVQSYTRVFDGFPGHRPGCARAQQRVLGNALDKTVKAIEARSDEVTASKVT